MGSKVVIGTLPYELCRAAVAYVTAAEIHAHTPTRSYCHCLRDPMHYVL